MVRSKSPDRPFPPVQAHAVRGGCDASPGEPELILSDLDIERLLVEARRLSDHHEPVSLQKDPLLLVVVPKALPVLDSSSSRWSLISAAKGSSPTKLMRHVLMMPCHVRERVGLRPSPVAAAWTYFRLDPLRLDSSWHHQVPKAGGLLCVGSR